MLEDLSTGFVELRRDEVLAAVTTRVERGEDVLAILEDARQAMTVVGDRFQEGTLFLAQMMLAAELFKGVMAILKPSLDRARPPEALGSVVLATPKGDIHDLGKNIFVTMLEAQGFDVHDLGVDVEPSRVIEKVREVGPDLVGFSALITTAFASMKQMAEIFEQEGLRDGIKLMVGGGVTTPMLRTHVGADFQSTDAAEGVAYCLKTMKEKRDAS
jgi:methylmalonyl-CoA mutase cobalamin-binding domain/chain